MIEMFLFCAVLAALLLAAGREVQRRMKRARIYGRRDSLAIPAIWQRHFATLGLDQARCETSWLRLAKTFRVEPGKLRATDRFDVELRHLDHLLDGWLLLTMAAAESDERDLSPCEIKTVRDFVMLDAAEHHCPGLIRGR